MIYLIMTAVAVVQATVMVITMSITEAVIKHKMKRGDRSDNVIYVVEDLNLGANEVEKYKYTLNFNPKMWLPFNADTID
ncbi:MAG: hypothetical protein K1W00_03515 [Lachnospiraceae bacterium]